jgi:hypothetical protein
VQVTFGSQAAFGSQVMFWPFCGYAWPFDGVSKVAASRPVPAGLCWCTLTLQAPLGHSFGQVTCHARLLMTHACMLATHAACWLHAYNPSLCAHVLFVHAALNPYPALGFSVSSMARNKDDDTVFVADFVSTCRTGANVGGVGVRHQ